jgi:hypothetical protein
MKPIKLILAALLAVFALSIPASNENAVAAKRDCSTVAANVVCSHKTGAVATVQAKYRNTFQSYIDLLEDEGASIYYMGGYRKGKCSTGHKHPCGMALDVCQDWRDGVNHAKDCNLPDRSRMMQLAKFAGLFEGGGWCNADRGHVEIPTKRSFSAKQRACADPFGTLVAKRVMADAVKVATASIQKVKVAAAQKRVRLAKRAHRHYARARYHQRVRYAAYQPPQHTYQKD